MTDTVESLRVIGRLGTLQTRNGSDGILVMVVKNWSILWMCTSEMMMTIVASIVFFSQPNRNSRYVMKHKTYDRLMFDLEARRLRSLMARQRKIRNALPDWSLNLRQTCDQKLWKLGWELNAVQRIGNTNSKDRNSR